MKRTLFTLILILGIIFSVSSQQTAGSANLTGSQNLTGPMDLVVVLDTSASMSNSYWQTRDYLIGPFIKEFLRIGDTFHLISFAGTPKVEISRLIEGVGDVEAVVGRLLLMYPLDPDSNVADALNFAESYSSSLPGNRHRKIILVSDGDAPNTQNLVNDASGRFKNMGADLQYIQVPVTGNGPSSGRPVAVAQAPASPAQTGPAAQKAPTAQTSQSAPQVTSPSSQPVNPPLTTVPAAPIQSSPPSQSPVQPASPPVTSGQSAQQLPVPSQTTPVQPQSSQPGSSSLSQSGSSLTPQSVSPSTPQSVSPSAPQSGSSSTPQSGVYQPDSSLQGGAQGTPLPADSGSQSAAEPAPAGTAETGQGAGSAYQPSAPASQSSGSAYTPPPVSSSQAPAPVQRTSQTSSSSSGEESIFTDNLPLIIALAILALLLLGLLVFFLARHLHNSPNRVMAQAAVPPPAENRDRVEAQRQEQIRGAAMMGSYAEAQRSKPKPMPKDMVYTEVPPSQTEREGPLMLNLFVEDQNTAIGRRNIHVVKPGYTFSVGGGKSDFLIFLVPIPPHIADVYFDGSNCTFSPRKSQYFPDIGSQPVANCIGKSIRVMSDKRYELHIRIERYEDPLKALNKMLHSIAAPGEVR